MQFIWWQNSVPLSFSVFCRGRNFQFYWVGETSKHVPLICVLHVQTQFSEEENLTHMMLRIQKEDLIFRSLALNECTAQITQSIAAHTNYYDRRLQKLFSCLRACDRLLGFHPEAENDQNHILYQVRTMFPFLFEHNDFMLSICPHRAVLKAVEDNTTDEGDVLVVKTKRKDLVFSRRKIALPSFKHRYTLRHCLCHSTHFL